MIFHEIEVVFIRHVQWLDKIQPLQDLRGFLIRLMSQWIVCDSLLHRSLIVHVVLFTKSGMSKIVIAERICEQLHCCTSVGIRLKHCQVFGFYWHMDAGMPGAFRYKYPFFSVFQLLYAHICKFAQFLRRTGNNKIVINVLIQAVNYLNNNK